MPQNFINNCRQIIKAALNRLKFAAEYEYFPSLLGRILNK